MGGGAREKDKEAGEEEGGERHTCSLTPEQPLPLERHGSRLISRGTPSTRMCVRVFARACVCVGEEEWNSQLWRLVELNRDFTVGAQPCLNSEKLHLNTRAHTHTHILQHNR